MLRIHIARTDRETLCGRFVTGHLASATLATTSCPSCRKAAEAGPRRRPVPMEPYRTRFNGPFSVTDHASE